MQSKSEWDRYGFDGCVVKVNFLQGNYKISSEELCKYDLVITTVYHDLLANHVIQKARIEGVKTVFFMDGVFDLSNSLNNGITRSLNFFPLLPVHTDTVCVCSNLGYKIVENSGAYPVKYLPSFANAIESNEREAQIYFLITTANNPYFTPDEFDRLLLLIKETINFCIAEDKQIKLRIYDDKLLTGLSEAIEMYGLLNDIGTSFSKCIENVKGVFTTHSTIAVSCCKLSIPTCCYIYKREPQEPIYGWVHYHGLDLSETIFQMEKDNIKQIEFQKLLVADYKSVDLEKLLYKIEEEKQRQFYNNNTYLLLDSIFNFNVLYRIKCIYRLLKKSKVMKKIRARLMMRIK